MKKMIISILTAFLMAVTVMAGTAPAVSAASDQGGLVWNYRDSSNSAMTGITSPAIDENGKYIYVASAKLFYKLDAATGTLISKVTLTGSVGYNKIAPVIADGKAFIPLGAGKLEIVDTDKMKLLKTVQFADAESHKGHQTLTPAVYDKNSNAVYLGSWRKDHGGIYAGVSLDDYSVTVLAESEEGFYWAGSCTAGDYVVFGSTSNGTDDVNTPSDGDAVLYAYNKVDGSLLETVLQGSGSICTTVVEHFGKYYFVSKAGKLYEAEISNGIINAAVKTKLAGKSTCTPIIRDGKAYVGSAYGVEVVDLSAGTVAESYKTPADVKGVTVRDDKIYCTYNKQPGGIFDVKAGKDFFTPDSSMQQYCISTIVTGQDGTLYYSNDSNNVMAVRKGYVPLPEKKPDSEKVIVPQVAAQKTVTVSLYSADDIKVKWSTQKVAGAAVKYKVQYQRHGGKWQTCKSAAAGSSCIKYNLTKGVKYRFKITPYVVYKGKTYTGTAKTTGYIYTLKAPKKPTVKRVSSKKATLKWKKVYGVTGYKIYRSKTKKGTYKYVKTVSSKSLSTKITAKKGSKYYYKVKAYKRAGKKDIIGPASPHRYYKFK